MASRNDSGRSAIEEALAVRPVGAGAWARGGAGAGGASGARAACRRLGPTARRASSSSSGSSLSGSSLRDRARSGPPTRGRAAGAGAVTLARAPGVEALVRELGVGTTATDGDDAALSGVTAGAAGERGAPATGGARPGGVAGAAGGRADVTGGGGGATAGGDVVTTAVDAGVPPVGLEVDAGASGAAGGFATASAAGTRASMAGGSGDVAQGRYHNSSARSPALTTSAPTMIGIQLRTRWATTPPWTVARSGISRARRCRSTFRRASRM